MSKVTFGSPAMIGMSGFPPETHEQKASRLERENQRMREEWQRISKTPGVIRTVVAVSGTRVTVASPLGPLEIEVPRDCDPPLRPGMNIRVRIQESTFLDVCPGLGLSGPVHAVTRVMPGWCEVSVHDGCVRVPCAIPVKVGDRVGLDPTGSVVTENLGQAEKFAAPPADTFPWDAIVGLPK